MSNFRKYIHLEKFGTTEVENIELGTCYVFPKIDGTNASVWKHEGQIMGGSRKRVLSLEEDNQGFYEHISKQDNIRAFFEDYPTLRLYGEWLIPHSLKTYRNDAWRKFYVFDVATDAEDSDSIVFGHYDQYRELLEDYRIEYISPLAIIRNGSYEHFVSHLDKNDYLIEDGKGAGEGIVIKNYYYKNRFGRQCWAKIVRSEFKELHSKTMGAPVQEGKKMIEEEIAIKYCTQALIEKTYAKIVSENDGWQSRYIPQLLNTVYYDVVREESWNMVKGYKNPTINFKTLQHFVTARIKEVKQEIF